MTPEVEFACFTCGNGLILPLDTPEPWIFCPRCGTRSELLFPGPGPRERCAVCGSLALYSQRDFNRILGIAIVALGAIFAMKTYFLSLLAATALDLMLFQLLPRITICYACDAIHRGAPVNPQHKAYDHHVEDEHKVEKSKRQVAAQAWRREHPDRR